MIKRLTEQEVEAMQHQFAVRQLRAEKTKVILAELGKLKIGQALLLNPEDWTGRSHPANHLKRYLPEGTTIKVRALEDKKGWVIQRIG